jgi:quinol-cytochrome oxidoreductase complex cytochrome b subunit
MFETLKLVPGGEVMGIEYETIPILMFAALGLVLLLIPFLDRGKGREHPAWPVIGGFAVLYVVGFTAWGYRSVVPILVVLASGVLVLLLGAGTRHGESS